MTKLLCVLILFIVVRSGYTIKCYNCISNATNDCTDYSKIPVIECVPLRDKFPPVCIRRVLQGPSGANTTLLCTNTHTGNECDPPSVRYNVTDCKVCQNDLCNSYPRTLSSFILVAMLGFSAMLSSI
ncbi:hypothetical protein ILUMI_07035 [Ignelater luminosus]|uniref:Protein sleepless n=1 Tax=Ignelater luminosus TaxID=2038154 RepID=A0A8K0D859_IGNLU|nr:hypothetical protein ILUMI_07035 [Ignelater luminosus]